MTALSSNVRLHDSAVNTPLGQDIRAIEDPNRVHEAATAKGRRAAGAGLRSIDSVRNVRTALYAPSGARCVVRRRGLMQG